MPFPAHGRPPSVIAWRLYHGHAAWLGDERRSGVHVTYLSGIKRGRRHPSLRSTRRIAGALGVPVRELFSFGEPEARVGP